jgi:hypothetical protein
MSYNLEKKVSRDAGKAAKTVFGVFGAILGLALGAKPSRRVSRPSRPSIRRRRRW